MKKYILILMTLFSYALNAQVNKSVEKSIFNIQAGTFGAWINNDLRLSNKIALRTEVGLEPFFAIGNGSQWHPNIRLEPRYYYNLNKRSEKSLVTRNNSGNFFSVALNYRPDAVVFSKNNIGAIESYSVVPKWGIRRSFSDHFHYELGLGFGYRHEPDYGNYGEIDLHARIGYSF